MIIRLVLKVLVYLLLFVFGFGAINHFCRMIRGIQIGVKDPDSSGFAVSISSIGILIALLVQYI